MVTFDSLIEKVSLSFLLSHSHIRTHSFSPSLSANPAFRAFHPYRRFWVKRLYFFLCLSFDVIAARGAVFFIPVKRKRKKTCVQHVHFPHEDRVKN